MNNMIYIFITATDVPRAHGGWRSRLTGA